MKEVSLKKNYIYNLLLTVSSLVFPLLSFKYVSGILMPVGTGKVSFAVSVVTYFNMLSQLGIPTYGIRIAAKYRDNQEELSKVTKELVLLSLGMSFLSYVLLFLLIFAIPKLSQERSLYLAVCPMILLNALGMEWLYKGLEQYRYITVRSVIFKCLAFLGVLFLIHEPSDYVIYGGLTVFASSASALCNLFNGRKYIVFKRQPLSIRRHLVPVLLFFAMSCAITVYTNLDTVMLGFISGDTEVGYYDAAVKLKSVLVLMVTALSAVVLPRATYYHEHSMRADFIRMIQKSVKVAMITSIPLTLFLIAFAPEAVRLVSGSAYDPAVMPMRIIMPTLILVGISNISGMQVLVPTGREKSVVLSVIAGAVTDACLNLVLIPEYGASGAALGTLVAEVIVLLVQVYYLKTEIRNYFAELPIIRTIVISVVSLFLSLSVRVAGLPDAATIIVAAVVYAIAYGGLMLLSKTVTLQEIRK